MHRGVESRVRAALQHAEKLEADAAAAAEHAAETAAGQAERIAQLEHELHAVETRCTRLLLQAQEAREAGAVVAPDNTHSLTYIHTHTSQPMCYPACPVGHIMQATSVTAVCRLTTHMQPLKLGLQPTRRTSQRQLRRPWQTSAALSCVLHRTACARCGRSAMKAGYV